MRNAYRRLNLWNANTGASFEWVGRAINPYLGFLAGWLAGWLMIAAYVIATVSGVEVHGPSVLAVFGADSASTWANIAIGTGVGVLMLVIAVVGIKVTARTRVGMAVIEYTLLIGFGIVGLVAAKLRLVCEESVRRLLVLPEFRRALPPGPPHRDPIATSRRKPVSRPVNRH